MTSAISGIKAPFAKKVLAVRLDALGDTILTTPLFRTVKKNRPDITLDVLATPYTKPLLKNCPFINRVISVYLKNDKNYIIEDLKNTAKESYDLVLVPSPTRWSYWASYLSGAPVRTGIIYRERPLVMAAQMLFKLFTHPVFASPESLMKKNLRIPHETEQALSLCGPLSFDKIYTDLWMEPSADEIEEAANRLKSLNLAEKPIIGMHISDKWLEEGFQVHHFRILARKILQEAPDYQMLLTYGPSEEKTASELKKLISEKDGIAVVGGISIMAWSNIVSRCRVFICPDTSAIHTASACRVPVIAVYGSEYFTMNSQKFAPWKVPCRILKKGEPVALINRIVEGTLQLLK